MRSGPCLRLVCWLPSFLGQGDEDLGFYGLQLQASLSGINKIHIVRKRLNWQVEMVISIRPRKQHLPWENYNMSNLSISLTSLCESSKRKGKTQWSPSSTPRLRRETRPLPSHSPSPSSALCCPQLWLLLTRHLLLSFLFWNRRPWRWPMGLWEENASSRQPAASSSVLVST